MKIKPLVPQNLISIESVEQQIFVIRSHKIILDADLAQLYGVTTKRLNEQVKRNRDRFPEDFMFRLSSEEGESILASRSQFATLKRGNTDIQPPVQKKRNDAELKCEGSGMMKRRSQIVETGTPTISFGGF
jgi:hypothetical protein